MVFGESETSFRGLFPRSIPVTGLSVGGPGVIVLSWGGWTPEQIQGGPPTIYKWRDMGNPINGQSARPREWFLWSWLPTIRGCHRILWLTDDRVSWGSCFFSKSYVNTASTTTVNTARFAGWIQPFNPCLAAQNGRHPQLSTQDQFKVGLQVVESNGIQNGFQVGQFGWDTGGDTSCTWKVCCGVQGTAQKNSCRWRDMGALVNGFINGFSAGYFTPGVTSSIYNW